MRFVNTFEKHQRESDKSLDSYLNEKRLSLGQTIANRHKVYLDTRYWILLRDQRLGRSSNPEIAHLADLLVDGVRAKKLICPISNDIFLEILKRKDPETLNCSVELIDKLSEGVSILSLEERRRMELLHWVGKHFNGEENCHELGVFVWIKLAYVLGFTNPANTSFPREEELIISKSFLDHMWELSLTDIVGILGTTVIRGMPIMPDISNTLNVGKFTHAKEVKSLHGVFLSEIAGLLDTLKIEFREMCAYLYEKHTFQIPSDEELAASEAPQRFANLIYHGFQQKRFTTELPSLRIPSIVHAAIRYDRNRKFKANDIHDIGHATAALPYFDTFLTERSLQCLLTRNDLGLNDLYNCTVVADPSMAIETIRKATNQVDILH
jgi:hypothetical protein